MIGRGRPAAAREAHLALSDEWRKQALLLALTYYLRGEGVRKK